MSRSYKKNYDRTRACYRIHFKRSHFQDAKAAYLYIDKSITGALANDYIQWHQLFPNLELSFWLTRNLNPVINDYYTYERFEDSDVEKNYQDRVRHTSLHYPHYTSAYEDVISSASSDKWCQHIKKDYRSKKHVW